MEKEHSFMPDPRLKIPIANLQDDITIDWTKWLEPYVKGVEVTQAIQYYQAASHLTDANDRGADNSVTLVANKPAWARVYVRSGLFGISKTVTGNLKIERRIGPFNALWSNVATLTPRPPAAVATQTNPTYATERSSIAASLNFIIPQDQMWGFLRLTVSIWEVGGSANSPVDTYTLELDVTLKQTLRLRGVLISYNGPDPTVNPTNPPNINLAAPTVADLQATAAWTLTTNPVESQGAFSSAGNLAWSTPLTGVATNPGGCSTQWLQLNAAVAQVRTNDGNRTDVIYYGLLPAGTPIANVGGCESSGVSTGPNGAQVTMAHEVGHGAGLQHGPCGTPGDPNYPAYEPYDPANTPTASLGEYGLDINNGTIHQPNEKDYMSYCSPPWISLYHHGRLINNSKFNPTRVGISRWRPPDLVDLYLWPWEYIPDPPSWERNPGDLRMKAEPVISIIGVVNEQGEIQVQSVMRVMALPQVPNARATNYRAQLIGSQGNIAASATVMRLESSGCGCGERDEAGMRARQPFAFQALLPDIERGLALRIVRLGEEAASDKEVWMRRAPEGEIKIGRFDVRLGRTSGTARWKVSAEGIESVDFAIQFSKDRGKSWNNLAVGLRGDEYKFATDWLPSGEIIFRLLAHDGFQTTHMDSEPVEIPERPPIVTILHPQNEGEYAEGQPLRLWGAITTTGEPVDPERCVWIVGNETVGHGTDVWITAPREGTHRCRLVCESKSGKSEARVTFKTINPERASEETPERRRETKKQKSIPRKRKTKR